MGGHLRRVILTKEDSEIWDATEAELKEAMGRYVAKVIDTKAPELWLAAFAKDPTYLSLAYEFTEMAARDIKSARDGSQMGNDLLPSTKRILEAALVLLIGQIEANRITAAIGTRPAPEDRPRSDESLTTSALQ
jgi:hypothetical protein